MDEIEAAVKTAIASAKKDVTSCDQFELAVEAIIHDISNRAGITNLLDHLEADKQEEIRQVWKKILKRALIPNPRKGFEGFKRPSRKYSGRLR